MSTTSSSGALTPSILLYLKQVSIDNEKLRRRLEQLGNTVSSPQKSAGPAEGAARALGLRLKALEAEHDGRKNSSSSTEGLVSGLDYRVKQLDETMRSMTQLPQQVTTLQTSMRSLDSRLRPLDEEAAEQAVIVSSMKQEVKTLYDRTLAQEEGSSTLSNRIYEVEVARNDCSRRLQSLETSSKTSESAVDAARAVAEKTSASIAKVEEQATSYAERFEAVDRDRHLLTQKLDQTLDDYEAVLESKLRTAHDWNVNLQQGYREIMDLLEYQADMEEDDEATAPAIYQRQHAHLQHRDQTDRNHVTQERPGMQLYHETAPTYDTHQNFERQLDDEIGSHVPEDSHNFDHYARTHSQVTLESQPLYTQLSQSCPTQHRPRERLSMSAAPVAQPNRVARLANDHFGVNIAPSGKAQLQNKQLAQASRVQDQAKDSEALEVVRSFVQRNLQGARANEGVSSQHGRGPPLSLGPQHSAAIIQRAQVRRVNTSSKDSHAAGKIERPAPGQIYASVERQAGPGMIGGDNGVVGQGSLPAFMRPNGHLTSSSSMFQSLNMRKTNAHPELMRASHLGRAEAYTETRTRSPFSPSKLAKALEDRVPLGVENIRKPEVNEADIETQTPTPPPKKRARPPKSAISSQESQALQAPMFLFGHDPKKVLEGPRRETRKQAQDSQQTRQNQSQQEANVSRPMLGKTSAEPHNRCSSGGVVIRHSKNGGSQKRLGDDSMGPPAKKRR